MIMSKNRIIIGGGGESMTMTFSSQVVRDQWNLEVEGDYEAHEYVQFQRKVWNL